MPSQHTVLWDEKSIVGMDYVSLNSDAFDTEPYTEVEIQLSVYGIMGTSSTTFKVTIQISNDGKNWNNANPDFTSIPITIPGPLITTQIVKPTPVCKFMRCNIVLQDPPPTGKAIGATFSITAVGRN